MTQIAANSFDIYNNSALTADMQTLLQNAENAVDSSPSNDFDTILDKTIEKQVFTLEDIKNIDRIGDMSEKLANFKDILIQATQEVNMENSLNLTLAKDITEIISQLKNAVTPKFEMLEEDVANDEIENALPVEDNSNTFEKENSKSPVDEDAVLPIFEQILTFINNTDSVDVSADKVQKAFNNIAQKPKKSADDVLLKKDVENDSLNIDDDILNDLNIESVSSETDFSGDDFMQRQQSPEEYSVKVMLNSHSDKFEVNLEKPISTQNSVKASEYSSEKVIEQITKHMDSLKTGSKVNIVLNPESLGKVNLQILNSKDGLSAQFTVTTNDVRELLMKGIDGLKESLLAQGVSVDNISVKVSETEEAYNPDWTEQENSEGGNKEQGKQKHEGKQKGLFEKTIAESLTKQKGKV